MSYNAEEQKRIDTYVRQKRVDIRWMNSLKNSTEVLAAMIASNKFRRFSTTVYRDVVRQWADWFYRQAPPLIRKVEKKVALISPKRLALAKAKMAKIRKTALIKK